MRWKVRPGTISSGLIGLGAGGVVLALGAGTVQVAGPSPSMVHPTGAQTGSVQSGASQSGVLQPGGLPTDPVLRELALLKGGVFREGSKLPTDRSASIEQMLEQQGELLSRLSVRLSMLDDTRLEAIERRLASFERTLDDLDTSEIDDVQREMGNMRRTLDAVARDVGNLPRADLSSIDRSLSDIRRRLDQASTADGGDDRGLREIQSTLRSIEGQLRSIERKLP